jgi:hypothetical protein
MGASISSQFDQSHLRIYENILRIQSHTTRVQMIQTLLQGPEYVASFKKAGIYANLLNYIGSVQRGEKPPLLPGEAAGFRAPPQPTNTHMNQQLNSYQNRVSTGPLQPQQTSALVVKNSVVNNPFKHVTKAKSKEKAMSYFSSCLQVLSLQEEVALTADSLKVAYKKAATRAHPDKGGSEEEFEAVTRAYAYLTEILERINGGRKESSKVEAPELLTTGRTKEAESWKHIEPVRLNAKNLDMNAFNKMFEETRMPDPDDEGYEGWLKSQDEVSEAPKFSGKFNRDVFHQMFQDEVMKSSKKPDNQLSVFRTEALTLAPSFGVEIGRDRPADFTAPANSGLVYTDLKRAYTTDSTFSGKVADVRVDARTFDGYQAERKAPPRPLTNYEKQQFDAAEEELKNREKQRQLRAANSDVLANDYFERMKRLVITEQ